MNIQCVPWPPDGGSTPAQIVHEGVREGCIGESGIFVTYQTAIRISFSTSDTPGATHGALTISSRFATVLTSPRRITLASTASTHTPSSRNANSTFKVFSKSFPSPGMGTLLLSFFS
jgi:hypothetical protein